MIRSLSRAALSLISAALLVMPLASCGSDLLDVDGQWNLQTVGGAALPFTVTGAEHDVVITSAATTIRSNKTYTTTFTGTTDDAPGTVGTDTGTWTVTNSTFIFHSATLGMDYEAGLTQSTYRASLPGALVSSPSQNFDMVFAKQ